MSLLIPDATWAWLTIKAEAEGETDEGMLGVAEVIRNRLRTRYASDGTIAGTVLRDRQFSCWNSADPTRTRVCQSAEDDPGIRRAQAAWASATLGSNLTQGAVLYHATTMRKPPYWVADLHIRRTVTIGHHAFYVDETLKPRSTLT